MPILETRLHDWPDEAACAATARQLAGHAGVRVATLELRGGLGAGKTTFTRHLLQALGVTGRIKSPSYAVVEPHEAPGLVAWHFDFYRFNDPREWEDAGFRELYAAAGLKIAEWPEQADGLLPRPDLRIEIEVLGVAPEPANDAEDAAHGADADPAPALPRRARFDACTPLGVSLLA